jgi:SAM-dependent methyltransferase
MKPTYGVSSHYLGNRGKEYFAKQNQGAQKGKIEARKFLHFVKYTDRLLDFGCGNGSLLLSLPCGVRIGVEVNPHAREYCLSQGLEVYPTLDVISANSVDIVISNHALEHVPNPLLALQQMFRCLRPGGQLVLCLPFDDWRTQKAYRSKDINHHLYTWSPQLIGNLLSEVDFRVERCWVYTHAWPLHWKWLDHHLPVRIFDLICGETAWRHNRRQVLAKAVKPE